MENIREIKITILANVKEEDMEEAKRLEHHAEGIWEEYSFLRDVSVSVEDISEKDAGQSGNVCDAYKVDQLKEDSP